jgi:Flp pilus assembly protein TadD
MRALLQNDPRDASAMNFIGYGYAERGVRLDEAERLVREALRLRPGDGYITDSLG